MVKRAVKLVSLNHHIGTLCIVKIVGVIVLCNTTEKCTALHVTLLQQMGRHCGSGGLAMSAGHTEGLIAARQDAEHLGTLMHLEVVCTEEVQFLVVGRYGGRIDHQSTGLVKKLWSDELRVVFIVQSGTLILKSLCKGGCHTVVASNHNAFGKEIARQSTHADATGTNKIHRLYFI